MKQRIPFVIYIFSITAFALGLAEFVPIGITEVMAKGMNVDVEQIGSIVAAYALGAMFSAPILTALTNAWSRKKTLLVTTVIFSIGSLIAAYASNISLMFAGRVIAGMGHGLFMAVASSTAAKLAGPERAGTAVAVVFGGFTIAMALGVPLSSYIGAQVEWRWVLASIGLFGLLGFLGLALGMKDPLPANINIMTNAKKELLAILHPKLLSGTLITVFAYAGSFAVYTYIASLLMEEAHVKMETVAVYTLLYGVFAAVGNFMGGILTDKLGIDRANVFIILGLTITALGMTVFAQYPTSLGVLVSLLGFFTFASVPALQARLITIAQKYTPDSQSVAAGLNIAGFNSAIALGAFLGGIIITYFGVCYTGIAGGLLSMIGLIILLFQTKNRN